MYTSDNDGLNSLRLTASSAHRLFPLVLEKRDFPLSYELLRFIALLTCEIDLPAKAAAFESPIGSIESALRSFLTLSSSFPKDPLAAREGSVGRKTSGASPAQARPTSQTISVSLRPRAADLAAGSPTHDVLFNHPEMLRNIERVALQLLVSGQVSQLCLLFDIFSLDFAHFVQFHARKIVVSFSEVFETIHTEFGIPRCIRPEMGDSKFPRSTTVYLETFLGIEQTLSALFQLFSFHGLREYMAALGILLRKDTLLRKLLGEHPEVRGHVMQALQAHGFTGYRIWLEHVIDSA